MANVANQVVKAQAHNGKKPKQGKRISCAPNRKSTTLVRIKVGKEYIRANVAKVADQFDNAMRTAFIGAEVSNAIIGSKLVSHVVNAVSGKAGVHKVGRGWTANVSRQTLAKLTKEGVFA